MPKPKVVISEFMEDSAVAKLSTVFEVMYAPDLFRQRDLLLSALSNPQVEALIVRNMTTVDAVLLSNATALKVVGRLGVGLDNIDVDLCNKKNITVIPATGANARAVAEYVVTTALILLRGVYDATDEVALGRWPRQALSTGREIAGKTLGLVGFGNIGQETARLALLLGMHVVVHDPFLPAQHKVWQESQVQPLALNDVLQQADVLSLHLPLTPQTQNLLGAQQLAQMKLDAILINTARGGIIDEAALIEALRDNRLRGAALDVFETEPLTANVLPQDLSGKLLLTPHIAGVSKEANGRVSHLIADRVMQHFYS